MRFRKRPVVIEAVQFQLGDSRFYPAGVVAVIYRFDEKNNAVVLGEYGPNTEIPEGANVGFGIATKEGWHHVTHGDWIITGIQNERYPCKPDIFSATYEPEPPPEQSR